MEGAHPILLEFLPQLHREVQARTTVVVLARLQAQPARPERKLQPTLTTITTK